MKKIKVTCKCPYCGHVAQYEVECPTETSAVLGQNEIPVVITCVNGDCGNDFEIDITSECQ